YLGNIYKGRVVNIEPSIGAAFVNFGGRTNGFLHASDVLPAYGREGFQLSDVIVGRARVTGQDGPEVVRSVLEDDDDEPAEKRGRPENGGGRAAEGAEDDAARAERDAAGDENGGADDGNGDADDDDGGAPDAGDVEDRPEEPAARAAEPVADREIE